MYAKHLTAFDNIICSKDIESFEGGGVIRSWGRSSSLMKASNEEADGVAGPRQYILQCLQSRQSHSAKEALPWVKLSAGGVQTALYSFAGLDAVQCSSNICAATCGSCTFQGFRTFTGVSSAQVQSFFCIWSEFVILIFTKKICTSDSQVFPAHKSFFSFKSSGYDDTLVSLVK